MLLKDVIKRVRQKLKESGSGDFRPATEQNLKLAEEARFPRELIDFYRSFEPYDPDGHGVFDSDSIFISGIFPTPSGASDRMCLHSLSFPLVISLSQ